MQQHHPTLIFNFAWLYRRKPLKYQNFTKWHKRNTSLTQCYLYMFHIISVAKHKFDISWQPVLSNTIPQYTVNHNICNHILIACFWFYAALVVCQLRYVICLIIRLDMIYQNPNIKTLPTTISCKVLPREILKIDLYIRGVIKKFVDWCSEINTF